MGSRSQVEESALFQRADFMFPEGHGRPRVAPKVGAPAPFINALVVNTKGRLHYEVPKSDNSKIDKNDQS